ncbi:MAG: dodecin domain-containing protein [Betaproteobacteria bacterium]|nr:dodecin domain-containing protein [Betaproteobacteria bacterium]
MAKKKADTGSIYKVIELVGTSSTGFADAAQNAVEAASKSLKDIRVAEVTKLDIKVEKGKMIFRAKLKLSFKYHAGM